MKASIRRVLQEVVSGESLLPEEAFEAWRTCQGEDGLPAAVVAPASEEEMAALLGRAGEEGWRMLPAGHGRWLTGGGPSQVSLIVSTRRLRSVQHYEPADLTLTVEAGLTLRELAECTGTENQWLPLDPPGGLDGSLGAAVATGTPGSLSHLYGTARDHVLGLTVVSGEGSVLRWGGRVVKNVAGFDVTRLLVGSWGTLGVLTSVSARLFPLPAVDRTLVYLSPSTKALAQAAKTLSLSPIPLAALELMDPFLVTREGGEHRKGFAWGRDPGSAQDPGQPLGPALVLRILGSQEQVEGTEARILSEIGGALEDPSVLEGEESLILHRGLNEWESGADLVARMKLLPSGMEALLDEVKELRRWAHDGWMFSKAAPSGIRVDASAHVGAGLMRVAVRGLPEKGEALGPWIPVLAGLRGRLESRGGTLRLSQGPEEIMASLNPWGRREEAENALMLGLKERFDPRGILAPGRLAL